MKTTIAETVEIINKEFKGCFAIEEGRTIEVIVRAKKADIVYIRNGEVSYKGNCNTIASQIAGRFDLVKNF